MFFKKPDPELIKAQIEGHFLASLAFEQRGQFDKAEARFAEAMRLEEKLQRIAAK